MVYGSPSQLAHAFLESLRGRPCYRNHVGELRTRLGITGLWNYDLRRTLATSMSNELGYDDSTIRAPF